MGDWNPGDLCQVRRGKRWVDAEIDTVGIGQAVRVRTLSKHCDRMVWCNTDAIRPRPGKRGKLPEPTGRIAAGNTQETARILGNDAEIASPDPRHVVKKANALKPVPKPTTARSEAYLAHVRTYPCCSCGATDAIHAHHVASGGMGAKASDYLAAPLCWRCHQYWHATAALPSVDAVSTLDETALSRGIMWEAAARCLEEWITREGER